ncbi:hypothetical protein Ocin01_16772 [Orchesella cincta]|uniref:Uncharacterized protein n=1 Tax=Orchesella cincta TaxID=48709 RepID=A0A1D2MAA7_ORCCI|nr:hypothetical protein Ocin01_16772 [Orchesella cincta]
MSNHNHPNQVIVYPIQPEAPYDRGWVYNNPVLVAIISTVLFITGSLILLWISVRFGGKDDDDDDEEETEYDDESQINGEFPGTRGHSFIIMETPPSPKTSISQPPSQRPSHVMIQVPSARSSISQSYTSSRRIRNTQRTRKKSRLSFNPVFSVGQRKSVPSRPKEYEPKIPSGRVRWSTAGYGSPGTSFQVMTEGNNTASNPPPMFLLSVPVDENGGGGDGERRKFSSQSHVFYAAQPVGETIAPQRSYRERKRKKGLAIPPVFMSNTRKCNPPKRKTVYEPTLSPKSNMRRMRWSTIEVPTVNLEVMNEASNPTFRRMFSETTTSSNVLNVPEEFHGNGEQTAQASNRFKGE